MLELYSDVLTVTDVQQILSYEALNARFTVPCGKDMYYDLYRKFFWLLSRKRQ